MNFPSTLRAETNDPVDIQKADNDLLDKINQLAKALDDLSNAAPTATYLTGEIKLWTTTTAPKGFLVCDGSAISRTAYKALFTLIGTTYGAGDGTSTFNLPDLREASPYGIGTRGSGVTAHDAATIGQFKDDQMQGHEHDSGINYNASMAAQFRQLSTRAGVNGSSITSTPGTSTDVPITDTVNGTPRTGTVTRGKILGLQFIIKT